MITRSFTVFTAKVLHCPKEDTELFLRGGAVASLCYLDPDCGVVRVIDFCVVAYGAGD